ncbi:MAG: hypothetical protein HY917_05305 [Candidatus Diapherotrites archaeon]|nr:hypothetical protein [Candidatus Diapherotrites archaeon]
MSDSSEEEVAEGFKAQYLDALGSLKESPASPFLSQAVLLDYLLELRLAFRMELDYVVIAGSKTLVKAILRDRLAGTRTEKEWAEKLRFMNPEELVKQGGFSFEDLAVMESDLNRLLGAGAGTLPAYGKSFQDIVKENPQIEVWVKKMTQDLLVSAMKQTQGSHKIPPSTIVLGPSEPVSSVPNPLASNRLNEIFLGEYLTRRVDADFCMKVLEKLVRRFFLDYWEITTPHVGYGLKKICEPEPIPDGPSV